MIFCKKTKCCEKWSDEQMDAVAAVIMIVIAVAAVVFWLSSMPS